MEMVTVIVKVVVMVMVIAMGIIPVPAVVGIAIRGKPDDGTAGTFNSRM